MQHVENLNHGCYIGTYQQMSPYSVLFSPILLSVKQSILLIYSLICYPKSMPLPEVLSAVPFYSLNLFYPFCGCYLFYSCSIKSFKQVRKFYLFIVYSIGYSSIVTLIFVLQCVYMHDRCSCRICLASFLI